MPIDANVFDSNLTNANHVIFVAPLLTHSQHAYDQSYTQCVGRAKRLRQEKTVHVYKFMVRKTQDVDTYQQRMNKKLVNVGQDGWEFKAEADLTDEDKLQQNGSGWDMEDY